MELMDRQDNAVSRAHTSIGWSRIAIWCTHGWRIFRVAPVRLLLLALLPMVVEAGLQLLPAAGVVLSKLLVPAVSAWVLIMIDRGVRKGAFAPQRAGRQIGRQWRQVAGLAVANTGVFAVQLLTAVIVGGGAQGFAFASGDMAGIHYSRAELACILTSGVIPAAFLFFVNARVLLDALDLWSALTENARLLVRYRRPVSLYMLGMAAMVAGLLWMPILLLVLLPVGLYVGYAAYRDVFEPLPEA